MPKYVKRYGILDDFGEVVRWVLSRPSDNYKFIVVREKLQGIDWATVEDAPF